MDSSNIRLLRGSHSILVTVPEKPTMGLRSVRTVAILTLLCT